MQVLITGGAGRLGRKLLEVIDRETDWGVRSITRTHVHTEHGSTPINAVTNAEWRALLIDAATGTDIVINTAAISNVDYCETNREEAWWTNVTYTELLLDATRRSGGRFIQISTDHVFDGAAGPYTEEAAPAPINYYGKTKHAAENACLQGTVPATIVRTMWLYGLAHGTKPNFVDWVLQNISQRKQIAVATDELGNPTLTDDVAYGIIRAIERETTGVLHMASNSHISRWTMAQQIAKEWGFSPDPLTPVTSEHIPRPAKRPLQSGLLSLATQSKLGVYFTTLEAGLTTYRVHLKRQLA